VREVGGKKFGAEKGAEKFLGRRKGCVFGSSPKWHERPHPELVHWWLLVHSSPLWALFTTFFPCCCPDMLCKMF
jgi:hypothetical protein